MFNEFFNEIRSCVYRLEITPEEVPLLDPFEQLVDAFAREAEAAGEDLGKKWVRKRVLAQAREAASSWLNS